MILGKATIEKFIAKHPSDISEDKRQWRVINTKVMNEKKKMTRATTDRWNEMNE